MIANIMAKLRSRIKFATDIRVSILCDDLATLLDIVEAVAATGGSRDKYGHCDYCGQHVWPRTSDDHAPNCARP